MIPDHIIGKAYAAACEATPEGQFSPHLAPIAAALEAVYADIQAEALRQASGRFGVYVGDEDSPWWDGYRQAQREAIFKLADLADELDGGKK